MGWTDIPDQAATLGKQVLATATYALFVPSLVHMKQIGYPLYCPVAGDPLEPGGLTMAL